MEFKRDLYLQKLISAGNNDMIKIITGIRRCGKSYLLFNIFRNYLLSHAVQEDHIIGLALDDRKNKKLLNPDSLLDYVSSHIVNDGKTNYVILDEIQMVDDFVGVLLSMTHMRNVQTYVSGSNSKFLSKENQEQRPLTHINDSFRKVIISGDFAKGFYNEEGVYRIGIYDFLQNRNCLNE